jgi:hypothetical protein
MTTTRTFIVDWGVSGLAGTLAYRVLDGSGGTLVARTTSGVVEVAAGSGAYRVKILNFDTDWSGVIVWDAGGSGVGAFATESFDMMSRAEPIATTTNGNNGADEPARIVGIYTDAGTPAAGWTAVYLGTQSRTVVSVIAPGAPPDDVTRVELDAALDVSPEGANAIVFTPAPPVVNAANVRQLNVQQREIEVR